MYRTFALGTAAWDDVDVVVVDLTFGGDSPREASYRVAVRGRAT